jgi:hypothetical protein
VVARDFETLMDYTPISVPPWQRFHDWLRSRRRSKARSRDTVERLHHRRVVACGVVVAPDLKNSED